MTKSPQTVMLGRRVGQKCPGYFWRECPMGEVPGKFGKLSGEHARNCPHTANL